MKLALKLPLLVGGLLVLMHSVMSVITLFEARQIAVSSASQRLRAVSSQVAAMLQAQGRTLTLRADSAARDARLRTFLRQRDVRARDAALAAVRYHGPQAAQLVATQLRDSAGALILETGPWADRLRDSLTAGQRGAGPMVRLGDSIVIPVTASIHEGRRLGDYTMWWTFGGSATGRERMSALIGTGASVLVGTPASGVWTNLEKPVPGPPPGVALTDTTPMRYLSRDTMQLASSAAVPGTPWSVVIEFPRWQVMAPVWDMLRRRVLVAMALLLVGFAATWRISRHLNDEIERLTAAERQRSHQLEATLSRLQETQDALMRRERLAILGQLSSSVGHELRNPLGVMTNAVYYLDAVAGNSSDKVKEYLGILRQQISLSERIIGDLLDFARVKPPQRQRVAAADIVEAQLKRLGPTPGVTIQKEFAPDLPAADVDPMQVGQIVLNLLTNAVQALGERGGMLALRLRREGERVRLDVSDTGPGIPAELAQRIFEPLFTTKARGIGLGLAVSRSLAVNNESELSVTSEPGRGATFTLLMPGARADAVAA